jgi:DNA-directed RNA polymerase specialized sigma subunit
MSGQRSIVELSGTNRVLLSERTQLEIAKELGISRSYVSRIEKRALMKLYQELYKTKK